MKFIGFILLCCCCMLGAKAQTEQPVPVQQSATPVQHGKNDTIRTYVALVDGVNIPWIIGDEVIIKEARIFKSQEDRDAYNRLRYNVYKVMPYARFAGTRYRQLQRDLALTGDKKRQKELINACEAQIKDMFKREVENLTISQGEVLIKLIDRETGYTSYSLVKEIKGGFSAFLLQSAARIFGHNLKETYDKDEQRDIESILQKAGYDSYKY
ncbi:MAG: DUF4294 domain-containing protein [Mucilaginibacter sp.]